MACFAPGFLGARAVHLHVHMDGEVWRRLWGADGYPCGRRCSREHAACWLAQTCDPIRHSLRRILYRSGGAVWRRLRQPDVCHGPSVGRSRTTNVDRLSGDTAWLWPDVLPLPSSGVVVLLDGPSSAS